MRVPISGQVTGQAEANNVMQVALSQHYGGGIWTRQFQKMFSEFMGSRHAVFCNSGSSANLLAIAALELPKGSEIITTAVNFPTTVNAIIQNGHIPVFVDSDPKTLNQAIYYDSAEKVRAIFMAHTLGNPVDFSLMFYPRDVVIIEDCCDAVGSTINGEMVGKRGIMSTVSFYPAHHITTGEGGMVLTDNPKLERILQSYMGWGKDCWCEPGQDNLCGCRFATGRDHKYEYSHIGYNLKASDLQAAVGVAQMDRLQGFIQKRRENWQYLHDALIDLPIEIVEATPGSNPSWFGFAFLTDRRKELAPYLDGNGIGCRPIMGGNLLNQIAYKKLKRDVDYRVIGSLEGAEKIDREGIWVGVFPGIDADMRDYQVEMIRRFFNGRA